MLICISGTTFSESKSGPQNDQVVHKQRQLLPQEREVLPCHSLVGQFHAYLFGDTSLKICLSATEFIVYASMGRF
jgi:hypothetical protein